MPVSKERGQGYGMATIVFFVGILSVILLFWIQQISERQGNDAALADAIMDAQIHMGKAHLGLERDASALDEGTLDKVVSLLIFDPKGRRSGRC